MKRTLPFIAVLMFTASSLAQGPAGVAPLGSQGYEIDKYDVLDEAEYKFSYKLTCIVDTITKEKVVNNLILLTGPKYSKFFNNYPPHPELKKGRASTDESRGLGATEVYKNMEKKKMIITTRVWMPRDVYIYEEDLPVQTWTFSSDFKQIHGYKCQKATTSFLGRDYTAWFTTEIPISNGPWKLGGLPGMILEAYDTQLHYVFNCVGIEKLKKPEPIVMYNWHYVKTSHSRIQKMIRLMHEDLYLFVNQAMNRNTDPDHVPKPRPYNPLERE